MREMEVTMMRGESLFTEGGVRFPDGREVKVGDGVWVYMVSAKMWHARKLPGQVYCLGPKARAVFRPWLRVNPLEYLFQPAAAIPALREARRAARQSKQTPSQRKRRLRKKKAPERPPRPCYLVTSYDHAVAAAIRQANAMRVATN